MKRKREKRPAGKPGGQWLRDGTERRVFQVGFGKKKGRHKIGKKKQKGVHGGLGGAFRSRETVKKTPSYEVGGPRTWTLPGKGPKKKRGDRNKRKTNKLEKRSSPQEKIGNGYCLGV